MLEAETSRWELDDGQPGEDFFIKNKLIVRAHRGAVICIKAQSRISQSSGRNGRGQIGPAVW